MPVTEPSAARGAHSAPVVATHLAAGALTAASMAVLDLAHASVSSGGTRVPPLQFCVAGLHLLAIYAPVGLVLGTLVGVGLLALRRAQWLGPLRTTLGTPAAWIAKDPSAFAATLAFFLAAGALVLAGDRAYDFVRTNVHRETLAGYAMGGMVAAALPVGVILHALLVPPIQAVAVWLLGRLATLATAVALVVAIGLAILVAYLRHEPDVAAAYPPAMLAAGPTAVILYALLAGMVERALEVRSVRAARIAGWIAAAITLGCLFVSATTYGHSNRVRSVVEQRSVLGRRLVRLYASLSDRDGDRYPWAFGGGDCDDGDDHVFPGAEDPIGDGIDADCFRGDGSPDVAPRGDGGYGATPGTLDRPNFLVVTIDALRRDHLRSNGYDRDTSPEIDRFLESAVELEDVVPQSSRSLRSIPSMWTGLYPSEVAYGPEVLWPAVLARNVTLPEILHTRGYATSAVMATDYFERIDGFFQGFDDFVQHGEPDPPRDWAVNEALPRLRALASTGEPWLLWVHLYNCHAPYLQDGAPSRFGSEGVDLYDTEIGLAGAQLERLLRELDVLGSTSRTVVVLASDHGEGFGEHGTYFHSTTLYEEEMESMLAIRVPGVAPRSVNGIVGLLDVAPTLANLANVPMPSPISGRSLVSVVVGGEEPDPERTVFAELLPDGLAPYDIKVARRGSEKLLWWVRDGTFQYFDLATDPHELHDLSDERRDEAEELLGELRAWASHALPENRCGGLIAENVRRTAWPRIGHPVDLRYDGMFTMLGFDLPPGPYHPGGTIPLTFYYHVDGATERDLFFVADLVGPPGARIPAHFHANHYPLGACYHTDRWRAGEYIRDSTPIVIPMDLDVPVHLRVVLSVRDRAEVPMEGLRDGIEGIVFELGTLDVTPDPARPLPAPVAVDAGLDAGLLVLPPPVLTP